MPPSTLAGIPGIQADARAVARPNARQGEKAAAKTSVIYVSEGGAAHAKVKIALGASGDEQIAVEADWLKRLEAIPQLSGQLPRLLGEGLALNGRRYLMTSLAHGKAATAELSQAHVKFLGGLASACSRHSSFRASPCFQSLESSLAGLELHYEALDALQAATRDCWLSLASWSGPFVVSHGDFTPWTTQVHEAGLFVPDWDRAHTGANPLADVFHYLLAPRALSRRPVSRGFLAKALRSAQAAAQQMHPGIHWDARAVSALALAYLLDSLAAHAGPDGSIDFAGAMVKSYWRLMEQRALWMAS